MSESAAAPSARVEAWVRNVIGPASEIAFEPMTGATTSAVYAVSVAGVRRFVLRSFTDRDWLSREPDLAEHEAAALTHAARAGVPVPALIGHAGAAECGVPVVLMSFLPGAVELRPRRRSAWLRTLAETLATIHQTHVTDFGWRYRSWNTALDTPMPAWFGNAALWTALQDFARRPAAQQRTTFLHRDYHPMNILWSGGTVAGVVDWVNACQGPAGVDVAHCRLNLASMYGVTHANEFLRAYASAAGGYEHDPYWDVDDAMSWCIPSPFYYPPWRDFGLGPISRAVLRDRLREFLQNAVAR